MCAALAAVQLDQDVWRSSFLDVLNLETQLTHLALGDYRDTMFTSDTSVTLKHFSRLTALRHLDARVMWQPTPGDCRAVAQLQHLTTLELPTYGDGRVSSYRHTSCPPAETLHDVCLSSAHPFLHSCRSLLLACEPGCWVSTAPDLELVIIDHTWHVMLCCRLPNRRC
jgi:hypothetical protein